MPPETPGSTPAQGPTLDDAASAFSAFLDPSEGTQGPETGASPDPSEAEAFQGSGEDPDTGEPTEAETTQETGAEEGEPADTSQEEPGESQPQTTPLYTVKVDGKDEQVTLGEALKGYSRTRDYTLKTAALAEEKRSFTGERSALLAERQQYSALLPALISQLQGEMGPEPDWDAMYRANPLDYVRQKDLWREKQDRIAAAQYEISRLQQVNQSETEATRQKLMKEGREYLQKAHPAWRDPKAWEADRAKLVSYGRKVGYTDQEIGNALDPRSILIMDKARRYDELMANKPRPNVVPRGPRVSPAGQPGVQQSESHRARQRLAKSGSLDDAAAVFRGLLG
jgi:hypothetical protein